MGNLSEKPYVDLSCEHSGGQMPWEVHEQRAMIVLPRALELQPLFSPAPSALSCGYLSLGCHSSPSPSPVSLAQETLGSGSAMLSHGVRQAYVHSPDYSSSSRV